MIWSNHSGVTGILVNLPDSRSFAAVYVSRQWRGVETNLSHPKMGVPLTRNEDLFRGLGGSFAKNGHQGLVIERWSVCMEL